jgi:hypothetical protein
MSVTLLSRVFWTQFNDLEYLEHGSKKITIGALSAKMVMLAIADNADDFGENSWQSFATIASKTSLNRRSVIRVINCLIVNGYLSRDGWSPYGTNQFAINVQKLGYPPKKRTRNGRPEASDSTPLASGTESLASDSGAETSDSGAETSGVESPESSFNHPESSINHGGVAAILPSTSKHALSEKAKRAVEKSVSWLVAGGLPIDEAVLAAAQEAEQVQQEFEREMGLGILPWGKNRVWEALSKFLIEKWRENPASIRVFAQWSNRKFSPASPGRIAADPALVQRVWPQAFRVREEEDSESPQARGLVYVGQ